MTVFRLLSIGACLLGLALPSWAEPVVGDGFATRAQQHIAEREYWASPNPRGLQAPNRRHDFRTYFRPDGIQLVDRTAPGAPSLLSLRLEGLGRPASLKPVPPATVHHEASRVELRRPGLVEWYENRESGLEQGFTLAQAPQGEGELVVALGIDGARISKRGESLAFETRAGRSLAYRKLVAFDANGRELPSRMQRVSGTRFELRVDDAGARYPVVIDPILAAIDDTTLTGDQATAFFGTWVESAGDVNADGYADVIVVAGAFDAGEVDEGAAFVFLGGPTGVPDAGTASAQAQLETDQAGVRIISAAGAGDINGDGYDDVIVGSQRYSDGESQEGAAFLFLGGPAGVPDGDPSTAHAVLQGNQVDGFFGVSVDSAGDVNGDGYGDVIVGAHFYDAPGSANDGAAWVFHGSATGISSGGPSTADTQLDSNQTIANLGFSVSSAGDVNGDGYDDVMVGAIGYDAGQSDEGAVFVFHGSAAGVPSGGPAQAATQLEGDSVDCDLGRSLDSAGDVNGDGYADVLVGSGACNTTEGIALLFHGGPAGIPSAGPLSADATFVGGQAGAFWGSEVAGLGDVNGDGYADVAIGADFYDAPLSNAGAVFVYLGGPGGTGDGDPSNAYAVLEPNQGGANSGDSVAGAGDVNGDGYADVIIGAPLFDDGENSEGAAFIYHGGGDGLADSSVGDAATRFESNQADADLGRSVASAGDINGDGFGDLIIGAQGYDAGEADEGAAFLFLGTASGFPDAIPATAHAQLESNQVGGGLGNRVSTAGDVNGDGFDDVIVGTDGYDNGQVDEGVAFVFHGSASGIADGNPGTADATLEVDQASAAIGLGTMVASVGDMNGDGYGDVALGAPFWEDDPGIGFSNGLVLFFAGGPGGVGNGNPGTATQNFFGPVGSRLGSSIAGAGDVNGDGFADAIVGANLSDTTAINAGSAFVFYGDSSVFVDDSTQLDSDQASSSFGFSVASAGDVNGDGFADVIVGAQSYDAGPGNDNEGRAFLFHGSSPKIPNGSVGAADTTFSSGQATSSFGASVAAAGDVNGDGFPDVVIGSPRYDNGETDEGVAFVYLGSATGIASGDVSTAAAWIESDQAGAELGWAVASAGDVNHDGFADLVVGAPEYDAGQTDEGAAFVVLSGPEFGRPALPRQYQAGGGDEIPPWGLSNLNGFDVTLPATHPAGRGLVKLEVEWCPPGAPFGNVVCGSQVSTNWTDVTATATGVTLTETLLGLSADTLYRWRARVLHAPFSGDAPGITQKANPPHGPWRRPQAQAREADLRVLPEPGAVSLLAAGAGWLGILHRWRRRSGSEPQPGAGNM